MKAGAVEFLVSGLLGCAGQSAGTSWFMPQQAAVRFSDGR
jgi:hypothetical protein